MQRLQEEEEEEEEEVCPATSAPSPKSQILDQYSTAIEVFEDAAASVVQDKSTV